MECLFRMPESFFSQPYSLCRAVQIGGTGNFNDDVKFVPSAQTSMTRDGARDFLRDEYFSRVKIAKDYGSPLIFKAHLSSTFFILNPELIEDVFHAFTPLVLVRRDGMKSILSQYICEHLGFWHTPTVYQDLAEKIDSIRLNPDAHDFLARVEQYNSVVKLYHRAADENRIVFEDFVSDPIPKLTARFNLTGVVHPLKLSKFIRRHDIHFTNIAELRKIYAENALKI